MPGKLGAAAAAVVGLQDALAIDAARIS